MEIPKRKGSRTYRVLSKFDEKPEYVLEPRLTHREAVQYLNTVQRNWEKVFKLQAERTHSRVRGILAGTVIMEVWMEENKGE